MPRTQKQKKADKLRKSAQLLPVPKSMYKKWKLDYRTGDKITLADVCGVSRWTIYRVFSSQTCTQSLMDKIDTFYNARGKKPVKGN